MSQSRRRFLKAGLMAAVFAWLPARNSFGQSFKERDGNPTETPPGQTDPLGNYSKAAFQSYLNSIFQLHTIIGIVEVRLVRVDDMPAPRGGECFSLLFRGGSRPQRQDTYTLVHPALGTFELLLVPGGSDANGAQEYVATINRLSLADAAKMTPPTRGASRPSGGTTTTTSTSSGNGSTTTTTTTTTTSTTTRTPTSPSSTTNTSGSGGRSKRRRRRKPSWKSDDNLRLSLN